MARSPPGSARTQPSHRNPPRKQSSQMPSHLEVTAPGSSAPLANLKAKTASKVHSKAKKSAEIKAKKQRSKAAPQPKPKPPRPVLFPVGFTGPSQAARRLGQLVQPQEANVPQPDISYLTQALPQRPGKQKKNMEAKFCLTLQYKADRWWDNCSRFKIKGVFLKELQERPKNTVALIAEAHEKMVLAKDSPSDACSGIWYDEDGNVLVAAFANRTTTKTGLPLGGKIPYYEGPAGRTVEDVARVQKADPSKVHYDGIPPDIVQRTHEALQYLHSKVHPIVHARDIRHDPNAKVLDLPLAGFPAMSLNHELDPEESISVRPGVQYLPNELGKERVGVTHLVHAWAMQGHKNKALMPSKDCVRGCQAAVTVKWYYAATKEVADLLSAYFQKAFPEYHQKYSEAFAAGVWNLEDSGPWLARALVYKLQVLPHVDGLDNGPTACFAVGYFTGGAMHLSDLGLKFHYAPGDVLIFLSGWLYHAVQFWQPASPPPESPLSSGRIGNVFFFPDNSFKILHNKPPRWNTDTLTGQFPSASEYRRKSQT